MTDRNSRPILAAVRVPVSSYAQMKARRDYYARNRAALAYRQKMYRAGIQVTTEEARNYVAGLSL